MAILPYEVYKVIEEEVGKEKAERIGKAIEEALNAIEKRALEQKPILKAEIKEELTKELATKADIAETKAEIEKVRAEVEKVRAEVKVLEVKFTAELRLIKLWLIILTVLVAVFNRDALGLILEIIRLLK
ncbi:hypothetical protein [Pampinifervens florentissimum]|uniref:hypothetical protein n=1 Tax=Pampinifervens florentissimum TaxID=1632019 RepID=UPI0013B483CB|nr:hypothetical protein [Hydrogenobacter sp. T-8]QID33981.1 hypothetical protein G3M65_09415 [Hydrogenobacter sp. T-8]